LASSAFRASINLTRRIAERRRLGAFVATCDGREVEIGSRCHPIASQEEKRRCWNNGPQC
jgi:hypothetical protein